MNKFKEYNIEISKKNEDLVLNYLDKIKKYTEKNDIEKDLYNDIEEMVFEKLSKEKDLNQLKITKILKEVGEPEIIFSDYLETEKKVNKELFYDKLIRLGWIRDNKNAIFLGISKTLSEKIGLPIFIIRLILFILIFLGGISVWLYILTGIILPIKGVDYKNKTIFQYIKFQIVRVIKDGIHNLIRSFLALFKPTIKGTLGIFGVLLSILRFIIFSFIGITFFILIFLLLTAGAGYFTSFSIGNIDYTSFLPLYFIFGVIFGIIASSILAIFSFVYAVNKKVINVYILSFGGVSLLIAIFLGLATGFDLVEKFLTETKNEQISNIQIDNTQTGTININLKYKSDYELGSISSLDQNFITIETSTGDKIETKIINTVYGNEEISKKIFNGLNNIKIKKENSDYIIYIENGKTFKNKVPFSILRREIIIYLPINYSYTISNDYGIYFKNIKLDDNEKKYINGNYYDCNNSLITYSEEKKGFICKLNEKELKKFKELYYQSYIINNFDSISSIKHIDKYKRNYENEYENNAYDWSFDNFNWNDTNNITIDFSDNSLEINANLYIEETSSGITTKDFTINKVEINKDNYDEKYYNDIESIKGFLDENKESPN
ncbi:MAG: PspC domain-containing protein [Candidatus Gracilibacteria bacterium]|nr:PspC domain-containing protein [Candidatus Gracilibacteria bacterium]